MMYLAETQIALFGALCAPPLPKGEAKKERPNKLLKFLLPTFLFKEKYGQSAKTVIFFARTIVSMSHIQHTT